MVFGKSMKMGQIEVKTFCHRRFERCGFPAGPITPVPTHAKQRSGAEAYKPLQANG
jgi:hypothetical protein